MGNVCKVTEGRTLLVMTKVISGLNLDLLVVLEEMGFQLEVLLVITRRPGFSL